MRGVSEPQVLQDPVRGVVASYLLERRGIGLVGVTLPFVIAIGHSILTGRAVLLGSVSEYYYTDMRNIFVGSMAAIGIFLICYRFDRLDNVLSSIAGIAAIGVALFPTQPDNPTHQQQIIGYLHAGFAGIVFVLLAVFCFVLFPRKDPGVGAERKGARNRIFLVCGIVIVLALLLIGATITPLIKESVTAQYHLRFWGEAVAIFAFGFSWLIKGQTILRG
jgi:hypothetical protein